MNSNWFEMEHMMRSRQHDLLQEASGIHRAQAIRAARRAARVQGEASGAERRPAVRVTGVTVAARLGGALVAIGRRLQGGARPDDAATCGVCGRNFQELGPVPRP